MRRAQLERMTKMGQQMVASQTFQEVAQTGVKGINQLFGVSGVRLRLGEGRGSFESGETGRAIPGNSGANPVRGGAGVVR